MPPDPDEAPPIPAPSALGLKALMPPTAVIWPWLRIRVPPFFRPAWSLPPMPAELRPPTPEMLPPSTTNVAPEVLMPAWNETFVAAARR